jgi:hypothetical protein
MPPREPWNNDAPTMASDFMSVGTLMAGLVGLVAAVLGALLGLGMIFAPVRSGDPAVGAACMLATTIACGVPGIASLLFGAIRLARRDQPAATRTTSTRGSSM